MIYSWELKQHTYIPAPGYTEVPKISKDIDILTNNEKNTKVCLPSTD